MTRTDRQRQRAVRRWRSRGSRALLVAALLGLVLAPTHAQELDETCTATILNRTVQVSPDGTFAIPNVPEDPGFFRVRVVCEAPDGTVTRGRSGFLDLTGPGESIEIEGIGLGDDEPAPVSLEIVDPQKVLDESPIDTEGQRVLLSAIAQLPDGSLRDVSTRNDGTLWMSSNPGIASVDADGLVTAHRSGRVIVQARNQGVLASVSIDVLIPRDADGDGMTDDFERANGLNPNDPSDAGQDRDGDGLTNLQEFELGTSIDNADTDGDGLSDGDEAGPLATDPLSGDSDGDGLLDGEELLVGTDPNDPDSDDDGLFDGLEVDFGLDPLAANPTTSVTGQVVDDAGAAVPGATALVFGVFTGLTDAGGVFTIPGIPADQGDITVTARSIVAGQVSDGVSAPTPPVAGGLTDVGVIQLVPVVGRVTGVVLSPRGAPVPDARVTVTSGADFRSTNADATGRYQVDGLPSGAVTAAAVDPGTGLRGRAFGVLLEGQSAVIDIPLTASGTIVGGVVDRDGLTSVGAGVSTSLSGPAARAATTDIAGEYRFAFTPLGVYRVDAQDALGNRGRTQATLSRTSEVVRADIAYLGRGRVTGTVETALGFPVSGAEVTLTSSSVFGGRFSTVSGAVGDFSFDGIFVGDFAVAASDPDSGLGGFALDALEFDGEEVAVTVTLTPAASLTGTVFEADGSTPVPGSVVTVTPSGRQAVADGAGVYRLDNLPLGNYTLNVTNPANGDRARSFASLGAPDEVVTTDVILNGLGTVDVTVEDAGGFVVPDAQVVLASRTIFGGNLQAMTDATGRAGFADVLAGPFAVSAMDPFEELGGSLESNLLVGEALEVTVTLEPAGNILGTVLAADGATPVPSIRVRLAPVSREVITAADGTFRFDMLPTARSPYSLQARDANGALRATVSGLSLGGHGDEVVADLVLSGTGRVSGLVLDPGGSPAAGVGIVLDSSVPGAGDLFATTGAAGNYAIDGVPEGTFSVLASRPVDRLAGNGFGEVTADGEEVTVDIQLQEDVIPPTTGTLVRLFDANNFEFAVQQDGAVRDGTTAVFRGDGAFNRGGLQLTVTDVTDDLFGGNGGAFELGGRQVVVPGDLPTPSGLQVRRKVYVPEDGYFARYLEVLTNPTAAPITVDVTLDSHYRFIRMVRDGFRFDEPPRIVASSNGDANLGAGGGDPDRWVAVDDNVDGDPMRTSNLPSTALVFDGDGAATSAAEAAFEVDFANRFGRAQTVWRDLTVPAGDTVIILHFAVQETGRSAAVAAASRLAQLPPEALSGLSPDERAQIANFDVPLDGVSALAALPPLDGTVSGTVFEGDGSTIVSGATVRFRSGNPIFDRVYSLRADATGLYTLAARFNNSGSSIAVPRAGFAVEATHPTTRVVSSAVAGDFPGGSASAVQDIVFTDSGIITGTVRRPDGTVASAGTVRLTGDAIVGTFTASIAVDGAYGFPGLPPGIYTLVATIPTGVTGTTSANVTGGAVTIADITLVPTGEVSGVVRNGGGAPAVGVLVQLSGPSLDRATLTDTGGAYVLPDVPIGSYTVRAIEPFTGLPTSAAVEVLEDLTTVQDLDLIAVGSVVVEATYSDGSLATQAPVQIRRSAIGDFFSSVGPTDFLGRRTIDAVPAGSFTVRVLNPVNSQARGEASGELLVHGDVLTVPVVVPVDDPPTVALTAPAAGTDFLAGTAAILAATASDDFGIERVEFLVDGVVVGVDAFTPYTATVPLLQPPVGEDVSLAAAAIDTAGNRTESAPVVVQVIPDPIPPTVALVAPAAGASFIEGTSITVQATATDNVAVDRVELAADGSVFFTDTSAPYFGSFTTDPDYAAGGSAPLELSATAVDRVGLSATDSVTVTIVDDQPPTVSLVTAPPDGSDVTEGETVQFVATAADDVGVDVDLFVDGVLRQTRTLPPFSFVLTVPQLEEITNPIQVVLTARDTQGQKASTPPVSLNVIADEPPVAVITLPSAGTEIVEGTLFDITADAVDDLGVDRVQFLVDGVLVASDTVPPYTAQTRLTSGSDSSSVTIRAQAIDTAGQVGEDQITIVRRDDTVPPTVDISSPAEGSIFSVGPSDVAIVIDTSGSTGSSCGADIDNDGFTDNILKCEILAAKELLNFLDPTDTRVTVIDFSSSAILVQALTQDFSLAEQALDNILAAGPGGGTNFSAAMQRATNELVGLRARRIATPIQLFLSDGSASLPGAEITRAFDGGVIVNTFAVGSGANPAILTQIADGTGGVFTPVVDPDELVEILPSIIQFGIDALAVVTDANDNAGVREVEIHITSADGTVDETKIDTQQPFNAVFNLPSLTEPLELEITVTARDFGDNEASAGPTTVTALPAENDPQIVRLEPALGVPGQVLEIFGKFFDPDPAGNAVTFNGAPAAVNGGDKILLNVTVPVAATDGPVVVEAEGLTSNAVEFGIDTDGDGLSDSDEAAFGTDPANPDTDGDGLLDGEEVWVFGTDPLIADSDGDGLDDGVEVANGLDPLDPADAAADDDGDGLSNAEEIALGTDLNNPDSDGDGLTDGEEVSVYGTDPLDADTDDGGRSDGAEVTIDGTDPLDPSDDLPVTPLPASLIDGGGFLWDIQTDGRINNGTSDAYDGGLRLTVNGVSPGATSQAVVEEAGRELVLGPFTVGNLRVVRKIFVPTDDSFARFLEIVENTGPTDTTVTVAITTNLGSNGSTELVATSSGDTTFTVEDDYLVTDDADGAGDPAVVHAFSGPGAALEPSSVSTTAPGNDDVALGFEIVVPSGARAIILHFGSQSSTRALAEASADSLRGLLGSTRIGLSSAEQTEIVNFFALPDADNDGLSDDEEAALGTDPNNPDTDGDGMRDGFEVVHGFDPLDPADGPLDADGDGLSNAGEDAAGTDPNDPDSDGDGLTDGEEVLTTGTDPLDADSDDDLLSDADELGLYGTDPLAADSDGDGANDGLELLIGGSDPLDPADTTAPIRVTSAVDESDQPMPAVDAAGNVHVAWMDTRTGNDEIFYSMLDPAGATLIDDTALTIDASSSKRPAVATDSLGRVHVAFQDRRAGGTETFYTLIDPNLDDQDGTAAIDGAIVVVDDLLLSNPDGRRSNHPRLAVGGLDRAHVVWSDEDDGEVHYAQVGAGGIVVPDTTIFAGGTWQFRTLPAVAVDSNDDAHVVWSERFGTLEPEIFYAMVDGATGSLLIAPTLITPDDGYSGRHPDVGVRADDQVVVTFQDQRQRAGAGDNETFMLRLDPALDDQDGSAATLTTIRVLDDVGVSRLDGRKSNHPTMALTPSGNVQLSYFDAWSGFSRGDLVYREVAADGTPLLPEVLVTSGRTASTSTGFTFGYLAADDVASYLTWADDRNGLLEVLLLRINPDDDGDGLSNTEERLLGTDPANPDSDADGLGDGEEVSVHGTDPLNPDTDGGGRTDGEEVLIDGTDPLDPSDDV